MLIKIGDDKNKIQNIDLLNSSNDVKGLAFQKFIHTSQRVGRGQFFTPEQVINLCVEIIQPQADEVVLDPACGSGAFLVESAKFLNKKFNIPFEEIYRDYLFGVDILPTGVKRTKIILSLWAILQGEDKNFEFNICQGDSLDLDWSKITDSGFDYVLGNPPYVRTKNLRVEVRENIKKWSTADFGNADLYIPFFELATKITNKNGRIGFITPSTYLTSFNAKLAREFLSYNKFLKRIVDFNGWQVFEGATTYTCITILDKKRSESLEFSLVDSQEKLKNIDTLKSLIKIIFIYLNAFKWSISNKS